VADQAVDESRSCQTCGKHFNTVNAYSNHLKSKKHREAAAREDVQQVNAKNEQNRKDATSLSGHCGEMGATGGVAEEHQLQKNIGTA